MHTFSHDYKCAALLFGTIKRWTLQLTVLLTDWMTRESTLGQKLELKRENTTVISSKTPTYVETRLLCMFCVCIVMVLVNTSVCEAAVFAKLIPFRHPKCGLCL